MVSIRYFSPAPALRDYVSSYYWFESNLPTFADLMRAELAQIRLITVGQTTNTYCSGQVRASTGAMLQGPTSGPVRFAGQGPLQLFGIGLMPLGWSVLIGAAADTLANDTVDFGSVMGTAADAVLDAVASARSDAERVAAADAFLLRLLARSHAAPIWFTRLTDEWLTSSRNPDLDQLVAASGMSARSVERMAKRIYGAPPKLLARKYRALHAAVQLGNNEVGCWNDLATDAFYDQAHFIREFKTFVGLTPSRFMVEAAPLSRLTIARKTMLPGLPKLALYS